MSFSSVAIPFAHDFECFDPGVNVFDDDPLTRQLAIERLLLRRQRMIFTRLIRSQTRLSQNTKHKAPVIVVLTKFDAWTQLVKFPNYHKPWNRLQDLPIRIYNAARVEEYSQILRKLLLQLIPDLVSTAETFTQNVTYVAVSSTGGPPSVDPQTGAIGYRSGEIRPIWVEVPFLHAQLLSKKHSFPVRKETKE